MKEIKLNREIHSDALKWACKDLDPEVVMFEVEKGISQLWELKNGLLVTRVETHPNGFRQMVVICVVGKQLKEFSNVIEELARQNNIKTIACYTERPGMFRLLTKKLGYSLDSWILKKALA